MKYKTKQRDLIINLLNEYEGIHFNVENLLEKIKEKNLDISRATLYRFLDDLVNEGTIKKIVVDDKTPVCYQLCNLSNHHHFHLICEKCGKLIHLDCHDIDKLISHIQKEHDFIVNPTRVVLYGICNSCLKEDN